jgi:GNAT superfamily N-acetyltransferase
MAYAISRLTPTDQLDGSDCGDADLNNFLQCEAHRNQKEHSCCVTYVARSEAEVILGYYGLATSSLPRKKIDAGLASNLPPYQHLPSLLLARLAVQKGLHGQGIGKALIQDAFARAVYLRASFGCRLLIIDAYPSAVGWYEQFGFIAIDGHHENARTRKMFIDLLTVEAATLSD